MMNRLAMAAFVVAVALGTAPATASIHSFTISGSGFSGSGTIVSSGSVTNHWPCPTCVATTGEVVTNMTGMLNGFAITGPTAPGTTAGNTNSIYPGGGPFLDWGNLGFSSNGVNYNAFHGDAGGHSGYFLASSNDTNVYANPISFTLRTVPEPASWTLMIAGFAMVGTALRRRVGVAA